MTDTAGSTRVPLIWRNPLIWRKQAFTLKTLSERNRDISTVIRFQGIDWHHSQSEFVGSELLLQHPMAASIHYWASNKSCSRNCQCSHQCLPFGRPAARKIGVRRPALSHHVDDTNVGEHFRVVF